MREFEAKRSVTRYLGLLATMLLLALFFRWNLGQTITVYAFSQSETSPAEGTYLANTDIEGGYIYDSDTGLTLYYQIYGSKENQEVAISGYSYSGQGSLRLTLPAYISHGTSDEQKSTYKVVGINGGVFKNCSYLTDVVFAPTYEWIGEGASLRCPLTDRRLGGQGRAGTAGEPQGDP